MELLNVKGLKKYFPIKQGFLIERTVGFVKAVDDVSFTLDKNRTVGIVGESGCGKTTVGKVIVRLHEPTDGSIIIDDLDTTFYFLKKKHAEKYLDDKYFSSPAFSNGAEGLVPYQKRIHDAYVKNSKDRKKTIDQLFHRLSEKRKALRRKVQIVFQDPMSSLNPRMTVGQMLSEPLLFHEIARTDKEANSMVGQLLEQVGLKSHHIDRFPHQFSGGQRQRIAIARAITVDPEILVLDEPTSALDVSVQAQIVKLLQKLQEKMNAGYVFISHNLALVRFISQDVSVMYLGRVVEQGETQEIFDNPAHPYTKALLAAAPIPDPKKKRNRKDLVGGQVPSPINRPSGCFFNPRCKYRMDVCVKEYPPTVEIGKNHLVACHLFTSSHSEGGKEK